MSDMMMRVARLSVISPSILSSYSGMRGICARHLHVSASKSSPIRPEWLQRIMNNVDASPPKLYAWTPKDLLLGGDAVSRPSPSLSDEYERRRIYVLGVGNIGRLFATCLSKLANRPPITLVVHRKELLEQWAADPGIELTRHGKLYKSVDFDVEWWTDTAPTGGNGAEVAGGRAISNLIVSTKAPDAIPQVDRLRRYLSSDSTVAFAQNGMCKLWPPLGGAYVRERFPEGTGPNWVACVTTHGVTSLGPFKSVHASPANVLLGPVMLNGAGKEKYMNALMQDIADAPDLCARPVSRKDLWIAQLEKLVVNAIINPLTAVLRCKNGELLVARDDDLPVVIDTLLKEASQVLCNLIMGSDEILVSGSAPEGEGSVGETLQASREKALQRFSFPELQRMIRDIGAKVADNTSSMLQDVRAGKQTEIDDINGWLLDTAKFTGDGSGLPTHEKLVMLVKDRAELTRGELCRMLLDNTSAT